MALVTDDMLRLSGKLVGARGSGKTLYASFVVASRFLSGMPWIVLDPRGVLSDFVLSDVVTAVLRGFGEDPEEHVFSPVGDPLLAYLEKRITYVPVGGWEMNPGLTFVVPTPFLYDRGGERLQTRTGRVADLWKRLSPGQENAPILGMPVIERMTEYAGMLLAAMGCQLVPDAESLINETELWAPRIREVLAEYPRDLRVPARYFLEAWPRMSRTDRRNESLSFLREIDPFVLNPVKTAQFGAGAWGVDFSDLEGQRLVIFDFRYLPEADRKMATTWVFMRCMEHFRSRGVRRDLVGFAVDELTYLADRENPLLERDFRELIEQIGRNFGVSCLFTYPQVTDLSPAMQETMDLLGWSLYGAAASSEAAERLADLLGGYDPEWWRESERAMRPGEAYTPQEQKEMNARRHMERPGLTLAFSAVSEEGGAARYQGDVSIQKIRDAHLFRNNAADQLRMWLTMRRGRLLDEHLREIEARMPGYEPPAIRFTDTTDEPEDGEPEDTPPEQPPSAPTPWL